MIKQKRLKGSCLYLGHTRQEPVYGIYIPNVNVFAYIHKEPPYEYLRTEDPQIFHPLVESPIVRLPEAHVKRLKVYVESFKNNPRNKIL